MHPQGERKRRLRNRPEALLNDWRKWENDLAAVDAFMENDLYGPPYPPYEEWVWEE